MSTVIWSGRGYRVEGDYILANVPRDEIIQTLVCTNRSWIASVEIYQVRGKIGQTVRGISAEPILREGLVEEEGCNILEVGNQRVRTIGKATIHKGSFSEPNRKLLCAAIEVGVCGSSGVESVVSLDCEQVTSKVAVISFLR